MGKHLAPPDHERAAGMRGWPRTLAIVAGLVALGVGSALTAYAFFEHRNPVVAITQMFVPSPEQVFGKPNLLVLVEGLDYDYTSKDEEYSTNSRSDVIWAVNLDFANKRIYQLSIPRDMVATMPNGSRAKINQAQSEGGVTEAKSVIAQFLGIPGFDRYVILRIDATKEFVNAIGGVEIDVKSSDCLKYKTGCKNQTLDYDDSWGHLHIHLKEGPQHLNGEQAVAYMRF
ncbi:MAG TPA: LCP family protein, partial [Candidatus Cybelea sp.]